MKIEHVALWTNDLETTRTFYTTHFGATAGPRYHNPVKGFTSYFLRFESGARLEIMQRVALPPRAPAPTVGLAHFALSLGDETAVRTETERLRAAGVAVIGEPRWTGDGYFESVIADPDGNLIELTV